VLLKKERKKEKVVFQVEVYAGAKELGTRSLNSRT
jgi:hypothetical protein